MHPSCVRHAHGPLIRPAAAGPSGRNSVRARQTLVQGGGSPIVTERSCSCRSRAARLASLDRSPEMRRLSTIERRHPPGHPR